jgi:hypothetical protein
MVGRRPLILTEIGHPLPSRETEMCMRILDSSKHIFLEDCRMHDFRYLTDEMCVCCEHLTEQNF